MYLNCCTRAAAFSPGLLLASVNHFPTLCLLHHHTTTTTSPLTACYKCSVKLIMQWFQRLHLFYSNKYIFVYLSFNYLRSSCPSWGSCIHPHQYLLWTSSHQGRWWDQRCTSVPRCPLPHFGSGSFYASFRYSAGLPGLDLGRQQLPGSHRPGHLPLSPRRGWEHHLDSQTGSEAGCG